MWRPTCRAHRDRDLVLAASALFAFAAVGLGSGAFDVLKGGGFEDPGAESTQAADALEEVFDTGDPNVVLLVRAPRPGASTTRRSPGRA